MSARNRRSKVRRQRLRQRILNCKTEECRNKARQEKKEQDKRDQARKSREALEQKKIDEGRSDEKTFITATGKIMVLNNSTGKYEQRGGIESRGFDIHHPIQQIRKDFRKTIGKEVDAIQNGTELVFKAVVDGEAREEVFTFILENENKVRAALVIADAISLGLIVVGGALSTTGVGAVVGGPLAAAGFGLGAVSRGAGELVDSGLDTIKKIKQLEKAVEVARITALKLFGDNREEALRENEDKIDARSEELQDEKSSSELTEIAAGLGISTTGLKKAEKARKIAETEIIGIELVEPVVGKSLLSKDIKDRKKVIDDKKKEDEKIIEDKKKADEKIIEDKKKADEKIIEDKKKAEDKIREKVKGQEDKIKAFTDLGVPRSEAINFLIKQEEKEAEEKRERDLDKILKSFTEDNEKVKGVVEEDEEKQSEEPVASTITKGKEAIEKIKKVVETVKVIVDKVKEAKELLEKVEEVEEIIEEVEEVVEEEPTIEITEITEDFTFSSISNEDVIDKTSRRKLDKAMKTGLINKPKNFNNPDRITAEQLENEMISSKVAKQKKATKMVNGDENIYNEIIRDLTSAEDCRGWLTDNVDKINILPENLKDELEDYCESILEDDEEEI